MNAFSTMDLKPSEPIRPGVAPAADVDRETHAALRAPSMMAGRPPFREGIRQLMILRNIAIAGQAAAIATSSALGIKLPISAMASVVAALVLFNALTWVRLRASRTASRREVVAHLGIDLAAISLLLFQSGGAANPFVLLLILHVVLVALLLPPLLTWVGSAVIVACFASLTLFHEPLAMASGEALPPGLLTFGQCCSFALTAAVVAWFLARIVTALREHDRLLSEAAQRALRDEAVLRVGALAAGAAHELASPLTTMAVVAGEIERSADSPSMQRDAAILTSQISICREAIANLMAAGGHASAVGGGRDRLDRFLESIVARCRTMRPEAAIACDWRRLVPAPEIFAEQGLRQGLLALLNNAVDASPGDVQVTGDRDSHAIRVSIADRGKGLPPSDLDKLGRRFFTTKPPGKGAGLGLVLASRTVEHLGGTVSWNNRQGGGTMVEVVLPMKSLSVETEK